MCMLQWDVFTCSVLRCQVLCQLKCRKRIFVDGLQLRLPAVKLVCVRTCTRLPHPFYYMRGTCVWVGGVLPAQGMCTAKQCSCLAWMHAESKISI